MKNNQNIIKYEYQNKIKNMTDFKNLEKIAFDD